MRLRGGTPVKVRRVVLWGRAVYVDADGLVFCTGCLEFVPVADLMKPDNSHPVGVVRRGGASLLPQATDDPAPGEESVMDVEW